MHTDNRDYFNAYDIFDDTYLDDYYMDELWAWIPGFYGYYMVSNKARVYSFKKKMFMKVKPMDDHGHLGVCIHRDGQSYYYYIHRLMADVFLPNRNNLPIVRHLNDDPSDNTLDNLRWGTQKDNLRDCFLNGNAYYPTEEDREIGLSKLRKPVLATDITTGEKIYFRSQQEASRILDIQQANIWKVLNRQRPSTCGYYFEYVKDGEKNV